MSSWTTLEPQDQDDPQLVCQASSLASAFHTPTSASWINQIERFFSLLTDDQIRRGTHRSVRELEAAIGTYINARNAEPKPFRWTKSADDILASIQRFCQRAVAIQAQCD